MNKRKRLVNAIVKRTSICAGLIILMLGAYFFSDSLVSDAQENQSREEGSLNSDQGTISALSTQLNKAGLAEKDFMSTQSDRTIFDYSSNSDLLKTWLRRTKAQYRLSDSLKLSLVVDKPVDAKELDATDYQVVEHPNMKLEFGAISDTHVYAFLNDLTHNTPGFIRIDHLVLKRVGDIDRNTINQLRAGAAPTLVEATVEFNWISVREKPKKDAPSATGGTP